MSQQELVDKILMARKAIENQDYQTAWNELYLSEEALSSRLTNEQMVEDDGMIHVKHYEEVVESNKRLIEENEALKQQSKPLKTGWEDTEASY